jgi:hypothetical protein
LASDISKETMQQISRGMSTIPPSYRGIYFEFRELKCPPASIRDTLDPAGTPAMIFPDTKADPTLPGVDPLQETFTIDTSVLKKNAFYQVRMVAASALPGVTTAPYEGLGDCPLYLNLAAEESRIVICFGTTGTDATKCKDTITLFDKCPSPPASTVCR